MMMMMMKGSLMIGTRKGECMDREGMKGSGDGKCINVSVVMGWMVGDLSLSILIQASFVYELIYFLSLFVILSIYCLFIFFRCCVLTV